METEQEQTKVPKDVLTSKVSICQNFVPVKGLTKPLIVVLSSISDQNRERIMRLRAGDTTAKLTIQSYTPGGVFRDKREASVLRPEDFSGVFQIDIDAKRNLHVEDWLAMRDRIAKELPWVVACGISCSGAGIFVLGRVDDMERCETASVEAGKDLERDYGIAIDKAVKNRASLRFMSLPEEVIVRDDSEPYRPTAKKTLRVGDGTRKEPVDTPLDFGRVARPGTWHYEDLNNYISISVNQGISKEAVIRALENAWTILFDESSKQGPVQDVTKMVTKYYDKYADRFGIERSENVLDAIPGKPSQPERNPEPPPIDLPKTYIQPELQAEIMELCALSPFVPMKIKWNEDYGNVCTSMILVGPPESGKNVIDRVIKPFKPFNQYITEDRKWEEEEDGGEGKKKKKKTLNHLQPITSFESSDAAIQGSLGRFRAMVMTATEIDTAVSSMGKEYNSSRNALLRQLTEGESISKILKNTGEGVSRVDISEPKFAMLIGGTPGSVDKFLGNNVENGFSSRAFVVELPPLNLRNPRKVRVADISQMISFPEMAMYGDYKLEQCGEVRYDYLYCLDICEMLQEQFPGMSGIIRGVRNCVKLAAVHNWIRDRRTDFVEVKREDIARYLPALMLTLEYIEEVTQVKRDHFGRDITREVFAMKAQVRQGKAFEIKPGVSLTAEQVEDLREVFRRNGGNILATAKETGVSRNTVKKFCKIEVVKGA
jgi:hypothetical protein